MAKFGNLTAPTTNPAAAQRLADTQALRARGAVQAQPAGAPIVQSAQQTGAALTQQAGQQSLQQQAQQAGLAQSQAQNVLQRQKLGQQQQLFEREQDVSRAARSLDQQLFDISESAAQQEADMRRSFNDRVAQTGHLQEMDLAMWAVTKARTEDEFKDRIQSIEQAHAKKSAMIDHAYKMVVQKKKQEASKASAERQKQLTLELREIKKAWEQEQARRKAEAANRQSMIGAGSMILGAGVAAAAIAFSGGAATPIVAAAAPAIMQGSASVFQGTGATEQGLKATGAI